MMNIAVCYMSEYEAILRYEESGFAKHAHIRISI